MSGTHRGPGRLARGALWLAARARRHPDPWAAWDKDPRAGTLADYGSGRPPEPADSRRPADCVVWPACGCPGPDCPANRHPLPGATDPRD